MHKALESKLVQMELTAMAWTEAGILREQPSTSYTQLLGVKCDVPTDWEAGRHEMTKARIKGKRDGELANIRPCLN